MKRRHFLAGSAALVASSAAFAGLKFWPEDGIKNPCLVGLPEHLMQHPLMQQVWAGIDPTQVWDSHVHITGTGDSQAGVWMNPNMRSWFHPTLKAQMLFYMNASCADETRVDQSYVERLAQVTAEMPAGFKCMLFAFDWFHDEQGHAVKEHSIFHVPNDYTASIAQAHPAHFEWVASIHPYRADALDALDKAVAQGARAIKWLPSGMGIDPASDKCDAFYKKLAALNIPIITHTGKESAVQGGDQRHGNPLRTRRALDHGVRVVLAHCASDGEDEDLDNQNQSVKSIDLFFRLMDTADYANTVFGEISAVTLINHAWAISPILARTDLHHRLINGSDYPLPGILPLVNTAYIASLDLLDTAHVPFLQALKRYNPLMFDFALKRLMRYKGIALPNQIFETRRFFDPQPSQAKQAANPMN